MLWVILLLVVAPFVELYVILQVAHAIGGWETIAVLLLESVIGGWLVKRQGISTMARIGDAAAAGRMPGKELADGFLILVAGALMLAPGFIGDVIAYLLLLPPTRALVRAPLMKRFAEGNAGMFTTMGTAAGGRFVGTFRAGTVVDATGAEHDPTGHDRPHLDP